MVLVDVPTMSRDHMLAYMCFYYNPEFGPTRNSCRITKVQVCRDSMLRVE